MRVAWLVGWVLALVANTGLMVMSILAIVGSPLMVALFGGIVLAGALLNLHFLARSLSPKWRWYVLRWRRLVLAVNLVLPVTVLVFSLDVGILSGMEILGVVVVAVVCLLTWWVINRRVETESESDAS